MDPVGFSREIMETALGEANACPRCQRDGRVGFNERMKNAEELDGGQYRGYRVQCFACGVSGTEGNIAEAVTNWNHMTPA